MFDKAAQKRMKDNPKVVESLLKIVMLCGKQGLPFAAFEMTMLLGLSRKIMRHSNRGNLIDLV